MVRFALLAGLTALTSCVAGGNFICHGDGDCSGGACESTGFCSFSDPSCQSGRRYGDYATGDLKDQCVGAVGVAVVPGATGLLITAAFPFSATVDGSPSTAVTWSIDEASGGSISASGLYTAPQIEGTFHVRAISQADSAQSATATVTVKQLITETTIANAGTIANASGHGQQRHIIYAPDLREWWFFYDSSTDLHALKTRHSTDLVTWSDGASGTLSEMHPSDGRDLSVAFKQLGGHDVVHISQDFMGANPGRYHLRATLAPGVITFGAAVNGNAPNSGNGTTPDGTSLAVTDDGTVIDTSGWLNTPNQPPLSPCGTGDLCVFEADVKESGTTDFDTMTFSTKVLWCVPQTINAHVMLSSGNTVYQVSSDGQNGEQTSDNLYFTVRKTDDSWVPFEPSAGPEVAPTSVFTSTNTFDINDWTAVIAAGKLHVVRRGGGSSDTYAHRIYDLAGQTWSDGGQIPTEAGKAGSGLFMAPYGDGVILVSIRDDGVVRATTYSKTTGIWTPWVLIRGGSLATRNFVAGGIAEDGSAKPVVIWTQPNGATYDVVGAALP